jgi:PAS domain S-box-containing protein
MPKNPKIPDARADLRRLAELSTLASKSGKSVQRDEPDDQRLLHKLEVHQIELEIQNSELRLARDEAEAAREKYSDLYDFAPVGYFTILAEGTIRMVNLAGATLVGMERSRLVGRSFEMLISPAFRPAFSIFLEQLFRGDAAPWIESELLTKGQSRRFVTLNVKLTPDGQECLLSVTDITARKRDEDSLRLSETRYRRLFEAAHDGVLLMDPSTRKITDANPFMTQLLGYPHAELVGKELFEIGLLEDEAASQEMFRKLQKNHEVRYENLPLESQGGRHQEVEVVANLYQENTTSVIQCNIRDITQRKQAEDLLRRNEALFSALIGQVPVGVYVVDTEFRLQQANPISLKAFSNVDHPIGRDFEEIVRIIWPKRVADDILIHFRHALKTGQSYYTTNFAHPRRDTGVKEFYEWQVERVILPAGEFGVVCFFNNITARIAAEKAQRHLELITASNLKLEREIARRQKVEEKLHETEYVQSRLLEHSIHQQAELRNMSHKILHAQEDERKRISRELHDIIAQTLAGINIHVAALAHNHSDNLGELKERIADTQKIVENSMKVIHQFALELRPTALDDLGLIPALEAFLKNFTETSGVRVSLEISSTIEEASESIRTTFFRIIQEALTNVALHAKASKVDITIQCLADGTFLQITDDGQGFEMEEEIHLLASTRLGLLGMKERAEMVGGVFSVDTASGHPTTLRVMVGSHPIKQAGDLQIRSPQELETP